MTNEDLDELEKMVAACANGGDGWRYGDSAPDGGFEAPEELADELLGVVNKTLSTTPGDHTRHLWTIHMADPLDASASLIIGHTGNGPTSEAHARLLSCAPAAISALVGEVRRLRSQPSPPPHAHPRDEAAVLAHEARGAVGDEEREPEGGPRGDDVG